jgi:adenylate cyclase 10
VGIATGTVFAGVVGTSGSRREYSVLGDSVNLSARLMSAACQETSDAFKVIVNEEAARGAEHKISTSYYKMVKLKGKQFETPIFVPLDLSDEELRE